MHVYLVYASVVHTQKLTDVIVDMRNNAWFLYPLYMPVQLFLFICMATNMLIPPCSGMNNATNMNVVKRIWSINLNSSYAGYFDVLVVYSRSYILIEAKLIKQTVGYPDIIKMVVFL